MNNPSNRSRYFVCEKCGKKLIYRKDNGLWHFAFGKVKDEGGKPTGESPVEMYIHGSIKIKCLRRECGHWNILNHFPFKFMPFE